MKTRFLILLIILLAGASNTNAAATLKIGGETINSGYNQNGIKYTVGTVRATLTLTDCAVTSADVGIEYSYDTGDLSGPNVNSTMPLLIFVNGICTITSTGSYGLQTSQDIAVRGTGSLYIKGTTGVYLNNTTNITLGIDPLVEGVELICEGTSGWGILGTQVSKAVYNGDVTVNGSATSLIVKGSSKAMNAVKSLTMTDGPEIKYPADVSFASHALNTTEWVHITATGLPIDETHFPDENFRNMLNGTGYDIRDDGRSYRYDYHQDGYLSRYELSLVKKMYANSLGILNMEGIQHFTSLKLLNCGNGNNSFASINLSTLTKLETLMCYGVGLTSIDLSHNTNLRELEIFMNKLTALDVSNNTKLTKLDCRQNLIASLDVSMCPDLETLSCGGRDSYSLSPMTSLNVSGCTKLTSLGCECAHLTTLDVSTCKALTSLSCGNNGLTTLDVSGLDNLSYINCWYNTLTSINLEGCANLKTFYFNNNPIASIDLSECPALNRLSCSYTQLTALDVSGKNLSYLDCQNCTKLVSIDCNQNILTSFDVSRCTALQEIRCYQNNLSETNLNNFISTLPTASTPPSPIYLISDDESEQNACTEDQALAIYKKGWNALQLVDGIWKPIAFEGFTPGDVNADGELTIVDVRLVLDIILGIIPPSLPADMNNDGQVTIADAAFIVNTILTNP